MKIINQFLNENYISKRLSVPENWERIVTGPETALSKVGKLKHHYYIYHGGNDWEISYKYNATIGILVILRILKEHGMRQIIPVWD